VIDTSRLPLAVPQHRDIEIAITFSQTAPERGRYEALLEIVFNDGDQNQRFLICRPLKGVVGDSNLHELLKPSAPYVKPKRRYRVPETVLVATGEPPPLTRVRYARKLTPSIIPESLALVLGQKTPQQTTEKIRASYLPKTLVKRTYSAWFKTLLWIEEHKQAYVLCRLFAGKSEQTFSNDIHIYDMRGVALRGRGSLF
jgi:helicase MOV-10